MSTQTDVIVVGCGPVGVMAALRCAQRGLSVLAIDKSTEIFPLPRAIGMDDEVQRVFQNAGLRAALDEVSSPLRGAEFVDAAGTRLVGADIPDGFRTTNGHPPMVVFDQPALEQKVREAATAAGATLELGVEAIAVRDTDGAVSLTVADGTGHQRSLKARWLIAADGASSTIRRLAGIRFLDQGYDQEWLVVDTTLLDPTCAVPTLAQQVCDPARVITTVPGHKAHRRWEIRFNDHERAEEMLAPGRIADLLRPWASPDQLRIDRSAVYRFHALVAETFRRGSIFLVGDAAHQMPPFNGQGMGSGMRDVENLVWKLALVAEGRAGQGLLDTYDTERRTHATFTVEHSADTGRLIDALARGDNACTESGYGGGRPFPHLEAGLIFGDHPAVGKLLPQPTVDGARLDELLGPGFVLIGDDPLDASAAVSDAWAALGARPLVVTHPDLDEVRGPGQTIVVRPDRYIAAVTDDLDTVAKSMMEAVA
jgi:3-(3-hydroxy-phenyl)propionate hydroxylase